MNGMKGLSYVCKGVQLTPFSLGFTRISRREMEGALRKLQNIKGVHRFGRSETYYIETGLTVDYESPGLMIIWSTETDIPLRNKFIVEELGLPAPSDNGYRQFSPRQQSL